MEFSLESLYRATGDQPLAIKSLTEGVLTNVKHQTLLGVTGSGKTYTIANVLKNVQKPTLVLAHNKTLAAQLYSEFKDFFPNNAVEYFVSYYDYYQPEAYMPSSNTYIEKEISLNEELEKLRLKTTSSLLSGRRDIVVVASVSCLYGLGNPVEFQKNIIYIKIGNFITRTKMLFELSKGLYARSDNNFRRGNFRIKGDSVDVFPSYEELYYRIHFFGNEIEEIASIDPVSNTTVETFSEIRIYPANMFTTSVEVMNKAMDKIKVDLAVQVQYLKEIGKSFEAKRLEERTNLDIEMMKELGYCSGIENYSRYFDEREPGTPPFCLIDYFPKDFLLVVDESHVTIPQVHAMYGGDRSRKENLVKYGFRLPAALDNRPLKFEEFENLQNQVIYVSATPSNYELEKSEGLLIEQIVRPTGLLDPTIEVKPTKNQMDDLIGEINKRVEFDERVLVLTITKRMAEELSIYFTKLNIRCRYIHSDIETLERIEIMQDLRKGLFDVLIGVNLLREGLDFPEVSLVAILDADKEGFLRNKISLTQTIGRAARNINGKAILYADKVTKSMNETIMETNKRRDKQIRFNKKHDITPKQIKKKIGNELVKQQIMSFYYDNSFKPSSEENFDLLTKNEIRDKIKKAKKLMKKYATDLDFLQAAKYRDEIEFLNQKLKKSN